MPSVIYVPQHPLDWWAYLYYLYSEGLVTLQNSRHWAYEVAVLAIVCVLAIFFAPLAHGPYSAVHGPVTALRALHNKVQIALCLWLASLRLFTVSRLSQAYSKLHFNSSLVFGVLLFPPAFSFVLRC